MSTDADPLLPDAVTEMSAYDQQVWDSLNNHWERRSNRRGLPNWANTAISRTGEVAGNTGRRLAEAVPEKVMDPLQRAGGAVADKAMRPAIESAIAMLELFNDWALELNDPKSVEKLARKRGLDIDNFSELQKQDLKSCDRLLTLNTLRWRTAGALEGGAMGMLALVPVAGMPVAITADIVVIQVLSTSIATRIAYSYGYDAKDPEEQLFIQRLVNRSFMKQAAKAKPIRDVAHAADALKGRVKWSEKLRADHRLVAVLEKLMKQLGPAGSRVPVQNVAKVLPFVGVLIGAGANAGILGAVAADAQRYCQTRFLCEKYDLPLPAALTSDPVDNSAADV
ncbi:MULTISPECIES: EcsC family protein [unclassified Arthrobacter]|uniref:EcsC family protein n=1 Tax=unclassified Arthrobacter TaxID=235627 RepID=UPI001E33C14A|nr:MULTISPECIES: EcsC family protein [unclassified Arthrobacter]MCC9146804.1 EcsC family protein [Arthrobacter sp. zg-Y919]MDK1278036.1 EcsC family protein [Arthrobacter sp. zg.Y919]WIB03374.1 EcsC family protein [Arthrobacter sp. zg-Y919]